MKKILPLKTILCPTDFSEPSYAALEAGGELATHFGADLHVVYVVQPLHRYPGIVNVAQIEDTVAADAAQKLIGIIKAHLPAADQDEIQAYPLVRRGHVADEIVHAAEEISADLIVIATHGTTGWRPLAFGSVAEKVVRQAHCPVLTISHPDS